MTDPRGEPRKPIGLIGLGNAGKPIGERLLRQGYPLKVYDLSPEAAESLVRLGAARSESARQATSEITITVLPSTVEVEAAVLGERGVLAGLQPGHILIDLSGTDPDCARNLAQKAKEKKAEFLGATLHADGAPAVTIPKGLASIVVGGRKDAVEASSGLLKDLAQNVICLPEPWMPKALKIAVIIFAAVNNVISAEVSAWLSAQGIDPRLFLQLVEITGSRATASRMEQFLRRNNHHGGALSNSYKDLRQALTVAAALNIPLPLTATASQIQEMARAQGLSRMNSPAAIGRLYELLTGTNLSAAVMDGERSFPDAEEPRLFYLGDFSEQK